MIKATEQHQYNVDFHQQIVDNSQAQLDKLKAFEAENPPIEIDRLDEERLSE
jgi:hypothetical protein